MQIHEKIEDGIATITPKDSLLYEPDTTKLREKIYSLVGDEVKYVVLDLGEVTYINSLGLGALISLLTTLRRADGDLRLARVGEKVENLFIITRLSQIFEIYETVEQGVASYKKTMIEKSS